MHKLYLPCLFLLALSSCGNVLDRTYDRATINTNIRELARSDREAARMVITGATVYYSFGRTLQGVPLDSLYNAGFIYEHYSDSVASADAHRSAIRKLKRSTHDAK